MKFSLLLVVVLCAYAAAENASTSAEPDVSEEGIFNIKAGFGNALKNHLKDLAGQVAQVVVNKAKDILTGGLKVQPTPDVEAAVKDDPSTEGIFDITAKYVIKRASILATEQETAGGPSHEGIVTHFGYVHKISEAEHLLRIHYNRTLKGESPSHEGLLSGLGGLVINGIGNALGGKHGKVIASVGDFIGNLVFAPPSVSSQEGILNDFSRRGIVYSAREFLLKGSGHLASGLLKGAFDASEGILANIFLARGAFSRYHNLHAPAHEIILIAKEKVQHHAHTHPEAKVCFEAAEKNFTQLFNEYTKNSQACVNAGHKPCRKILSHVEDIVLDAVKRVEDAHRETGICFDKDAIDDRFVCLDSEVPEQIKEHQKKILHYGEDLARYVQQFSDHNTNFDVCLVGHLGVVRREVYNIVNVFHHCVAHREHNPLHVVEKKL